MKKETELALMRQVLAGRKFFPSQGGTYPTKQEEYYLYKWSNRGWWDWGVSVRGGWLTDLGKVKIAEIVGMIPPPPTGH